MIDEIIKNYINKAAMLGDIVEIEREADQVKLLKYYTKGRRIVVPDFVNSVDFIAAFKECYDLESITLGKNIDVLSHLRLNSKAVEIRIKSPKLSIKHMSLISHTKDITFVGEGKSTELRIASKAIYPLKIIDFKNCTVAGIGYYGIADSTIESIRLKDWSLSQFCIKNCGINKLTLFHGQPESSICDAYINDVLYIIERKHYKHFIDKNEIEDFFKRRVLGLGCVVKNFNLEVI